MKKDDFTCYYEVEECGGCSSGRCDDCKGYGNCGLCLNFYKYKIDDCKKCMWFDPEQHKIKYTPVSSVPTPSDDLPF